jgi:hypothetical protein
MISYNPDEFVIWRQSELMAEAEKQRLVAHIPAQQNGWRHDLAAACFRLASWLDEPAGYVQMPEPGPEDWAAPLASV